MSRPSVWAWGVQSFGWYGLTEAKSDASNGLLTLERGLGLILNFAFD